MQNNNNGINNNANNMPSNGGNNQAPNQGQLPLLNNQNINYYPPGQQCPQYIPNQMNQYRQQWHPNNMPRPGYVGIPPNQVVNRLTPSLPQPKPNFMPPVHNNNQYFGSPVNNQYMVKPPPVCYRSHMITPSPKLSPIYPRPKMGPVEGLPMMKRPMMMVPPMHMKAVPMGSPMLSNDPNLDTRQPFKRIDNPKISFMAERANQCSLLYSAVKDRNVVSYLGLRVTKLQPPLRVKNFKFDEKNLPYKEIKANALWQYIESWRGSMFELSTSKASDGYKVAINPSTLLLLGSLIEMKLIDILTELVKASKGSQKITMEHFNTCVQNKYFDIGVSTLKKIDMLSAKISKHY